MKQAAKKKVFLILKIAVNVILYIFFAMCLLMLIFTITAKKNADGAPVVFGYEVRRVLTNSMEECELTDVSGYEIKDLPVNCAIFIQVVPENAEEAEEWYANLKVGDVLTFKYVYASQQSTITHRIVEIEENGKGGYTVTLEGDNKNAEGSNLKQVLDTSETGGTSYIIGKVTGKSMFVGYLLAVFDSKAGIACIVIIPCAVIILLEVFNICNAVGKNKKEKQQAMQTEKDKELEDLKKRLEELEKGAAAAPEQPAETVGGTGGTEYKNASSEPEAGTPEAGIKQK